jgi:hypothetical protein
MKKIFALIIICVFCFTNTNAQKKQKPKPNDLIISLDNVDNDSRRHNSSNNSEDEDAIKNLLSIPITGAFVGDIMPCYERKISKIISIRVGAGPTIGNAFKQLAYQRSDEINNERITWTDVDQFSSRYDQNTGLFNKKNYTFKGGYGFKIEPRFHTNDDFLEGFYFGGTIRYYRNNFRNDMPFVDSNGGAVELVPYGKLKNKEINLDYCLVIGANYYVSNKFLIDWGCNLGARNVKITRNSFCSQYDQNANSYVLKTGEYIGIATRPIVETYVRVAYKF